MLELLLVMVVLGLVLGLGLGAFASLDFASAQAVDVAKGALRTARNGARARHAPASVRISADRSALVPRALEVVGTWRFESGDLAGAFGLAGQLEGARATEHGHLGRGLELPPGRARATFAIHEDPAFDFREGFALDLALWSAGGAGRVADCGGAFGLAVGDAGELRAWFVPALETAGGERAGAEVALASAPGTVPPGAWVRVRARYDRRELALVVDGAVVAERSDDAPVAAVGGPLVLGGSETAFAGRLDELVLAAWIEEKPYELPDGVLLAPSTPAVIAFDENGGLDPRAHPAEQRTGLALTLVFEAGREALVHVNPWGTVE